MASFLAAATGGRAFDTHGCQWVWQPSGNAWSCSSHTPPESAGLPPGLAEGARLGAREVHVWLNAAARDSELLGLGFRDAPPVFWHAGGFDDVAAAARSRQGWDGAVELTRVLPEATGPDADELAIVDPGQIEHAVARTPAGELAGRGLAYRHEGGDVSIHDLAVGPSSRRRGAGTALLAALAGPLGSLGSPDQLLAASTPGASAFFRANGMDLVGKGRHLVQ
ncbi:GNAT family N-acetyltransferase [Arthrobacter sp.]|uniref:GNAT family N-acetyltransferase n=1 Tax=Arthrobacter sp. TaxID=1667 RepID=UPI003A92265A